MSVATLGDAYPVQQARVRTILGHYQAIGPAGAFGALWIEELLQRADRAAIAQDLPAMIQIYREMLQVQE